MVWIDQRATVRTKQSSGPKKGWEREGVKLVESTDPILRNKCRPVLKEEISGLTSKISAMKKFMWKNKGVGFAAPQIGDDRAFFVWKFGGVINPEIIHKGQEKSSMQEGCLSFPKRTALKSRSVQIKVSFIDEKGKDHVMDLEGFNARIFQHEYDHLNGVCLF